MPRRIYTYLPETGWDAMNLLSTIGAGILGIGFAVFFVNALLSRTRGDVAGDDPWGGATLEWAQPSPAPKATERKVPIVHGRYPLWEGGLGAVIGLHENENLVCRIVDAEPDHKVQMPGPGFAPIFTAVATAGLILACIMTPWGLVFGAVPVAIGLVAWYWPRNPEPDVLHSEQP
jgi:cytochrome c oxidase subunit 1